MRRPSIRRRLILGCLLVSAVVLGSSKVLVYQDVVRSIRHEFDQQLLRSANLLSKSAELEAGGIIYEWKEALDSSGGLGLDGLFQFWDLRSGLTTRSPDLREDNLEFFHGKLYEPVFRDFVLKNGSKVRAVGLLHHPFTNIYGIEEMKRRGAMLRIEDYPQVVVCARETAGIDKELMETRWGLVKSGVLTLIAIWVAILLIIRWTFAPLDRLVAGLVKRSTEVGTPLPVIPDDLPIELYPLASAFNSTLERVEVARAHEKDFAFSAAHQLRTPIAGIHAILELAYLKPKDGEDLHQRIGAALNVSREMKLTINTLMQLARLRGGIEEMRSTSLQGTSLGGPASEAREADVVSFQPGLILDELLEAEARRDERGLQVKDGGIDRSLRLKGDGGMFRMLAFNLIENAFRYTPEGGEIQVKTSGSGEFVLEVTNSRGDFREEDAERIFRPFQRGSRVSVNSPGAGLGLALAKEIAGYLGGGLDLLVEERFLTFRLRMPL